MITMITWSHIIQHGSLHVHPKMTSLSRNHPIRYEAKHVSYYSTINEAVSSAKNGDRIVVHPGVYCEQVVLYKNTILIGADSQCDYYTVIMWLLCIVMLIVAVWWSYTSSNIIPYTMKVLRQKSFTVFILFCMSAKLFTWKFKMALFIRIWIKGKEGGILRIFFGKGLRVELAA